jgi:hypothetical protein
MPAKNVKEIISKEEITEILLHGEIDLQGQFILGSNYTFLVRLEHKGKCIKAVYKPSEGEMPLWDFPAETLAARETAAYLISEALEWELVPPTAMRSKGPFGKGSLQLFIPHDPELNYFSFDKAIRDRLEPAAVFDMVINNADRKGSHIILDENQHIWLIDHGLCFHPISKLRTVIWDFSGRPIKKELVDQLGSLAEKLKKDKEFTEKLSNFLNPEEISAIKKRILFIINHPVFPTPDTNKRQFPWPLV